MAVSVLSDPREAMGPCSGGTERKGGYDLSDVGHHVAFRSLFSCGWICAIMFVLIRLFSSIFLAVDGFQTDIIVYDQEDVVQLPISAPNCGLCIWGMNSSTEERDSCCQRW